MSSSFSARAAASPRHRQYLRALMASEEIQPNSNVLLRGGPDSFYGGPGQVPTWNPGPPTPARPFPIDLRSQTLAPTIAPPAAPSPPTRPGSPDAPLRTVGRLVADFQRNIVTNLAVSPPPVSASVADMPVRPRQRLRSDFLEGPVPVSPAPAPVGIGTTDLPVRLSRRWAMDFVAAPVPDNPTPAGQSSIPSRSRLSPPAPAPASWALQLVASLPVQPSPFLPSVAIERPVRAARRLTADFLGLAPPDNPTPAGQSVVPSRALLNVLRVAPAGWTLQLVTALAVQPAPFVLPSADPAAPGRAYPAALRSMLPVLQITLLAPSLPDARGQAEPLPLSRPVLRQFGVLGLQQLLLGADQFYGAAGQAPTWSPDLPPRVAPRIRTDAVVQALQVSLFVPPPGVLPDGRASVEPAPPARRPERQHTALVLNLNLLGQDTFYGAPGQAPGISLEPPLVRLRARPDTGTLVNTALATVLPVPLLPILSDPTLRARPQPTHPSITLALAGTLLAPPAQPPFAPAVTSRQADLWLGRLPLLTNSLGFSAQQILDQTRAPFAPAVTERRGDPWLGRQVLLGYVLLVQPQAPQQQFYAPGQVAPWGNFPLPPRGYPRGVALLTRDPVQVLLNIIDITFDTQGPAAAALLYEAFSDALAAPYEAFSAIVGALYQAAADGLGLRYEARADGLPDIDYEADSDPLR